MKRIVDVEEVFSEFAFDETAFAIIHAKGDECQTGYPAATEDAAANDCLNDFGVVEEVENENETKTVATIVGIEEDGNDEK